MIPESTEGYFELPFVAKQMQRTNTPIEMTHDIADLIKTPAVQAQIARLCIYLWGENSDGQKSSVIFERRVYNFQLGFYGLYTIKDDPTDPVPREYFYELNQRLVKVTASELRIVPLVLDAIARKGVPTEGRILSQ